MTALAPPFDALAPRASVLGLDAKTYVPHRLHRPDAGRVWLETNCYVDLWIELLHAAGLPPEAALGFTVAADFEGDQWTFYKFPLEDLERLFGVATHELSIWRAPELHTLEQLHRGRVVLMEVDSYFLPDSKGVAYRQEHIKTTVGITALDLEQHRVGYFHNAGYYSAEGDDFAGLFRLEDPWTPASLRMLPYTEYAKLDGLRRRSLPELGAEALALLRGHFARRPKQNPFVQYEARFARDLDWLRTRPIGEFHQYAFVSLRQFGSCFELAGDFCRWLQSVCGGLDLEPAAEELTGIGADARALQMKVARAVMTKKPLDVAAPIAVLGGRWDRAMAALARELGR
jgi:hypothetical protein